MSVDKKTLLVYYSRNGTTRTVGEAIARELKCDIEEIVPEKGYGGLFGFIRGGYQASTKKMPPIRPGTKNPSEYELVIIGTPVWGSTMASPVRTWLAQHPRTFNKVALFCTMGGDNSGHTFPDMGMYVDADAIATMAVRRTEVAAQQFGEKVKKFVAALML